MLRLPSIVPMVAAARRMHLPPNIWTHSYIENQRFNYCVFTELLIGLLVMDFIAVQIEMVCLENF